MKKLKPFVPNEKNYEIFLQWMEEMKKINKIPKGPIFYEAKVNELLVAESGEIASFNDNEPLDDLYMIPHLFIVHIGFTRGEYTDSCSFTFHFGKRYGAIQAWCKLGADEEHNAPLVAIWDEFWQEKYPDEYEGSKFTTSKLWEILTTFITWEQEHLPVKSL